MHGATQCARRARKPALVQRAGSDMSLGLWTDAEPAVQSYVPASLYPAVQSYVPAAAAAATAPPAVPAAPASSGGTPPQESPPAAAPGSTPRTARQPGEPHGARDWHLCLADATFDCLRCAGQQWLQNWS